MGNLYFKSSRGEKRLVKEGIEKDEVEKAIRAYTRELNPNYKIYYIRYWGDENQTTYDVGSWSELFIYIPDKI